MVKNHFFLVLLVFWAFLCQKSISKGKRGRSLTQLGQLYRIGYDWTKSIRCFFFALGAPCVKERNTLCILWISIISDSKTELATLIKEEQWTVEILVTKTREMIIDDGQMISFSADEGKETVDHGSNRCDWTATMWQDHRDLNGSYRRTDEKDQS